MRNNFARIELDVCTSRWQIQDTSMERESVKDLLNFEITLQRIAIREELSLY